MAAASGGGHSEQGGASLSPALAPTFAQTAALAGVTGILLVAGIAVTLQSSARYSGDTVNVGPASATT